MSAKDSTKLTPRMREVLTHLAAGRPSDTGVRGRSEFGGLSSTLVALRRRGLIDIKSKITDMGRAAIDPTFTEDRGERVGGEDA